MIFNDKFLINSKLIPKPSKRRSGLMIAKVRFLVVHDTGNINSTAAQNVNYYINSKDEISASAHLFVDDKEIIECVPALTASPEKAWHVLYNIPKDNELYGVNANDAAIGIEYCYGENIDADKAYAKFVWLLAKLCFHFELDPAKDIVGHFFLDPSRKTDPVTGLAHSRRSYDRLLKDIVIEYQTCIGNEHAIDWQLEAADGAVVTNVKMNIRMEPRTMSAICKVVAPKSTINTKGIILNGEKINNNPQWYLTEDNNYIWSGGVSKIENRNKTFADKNPLSRPTKPAQLDLPINQTTCIKCAEWMNMHFGNQFHELLLGTPFSKELLFAIACQETAIYWYQWIHEHTPFEILARCVFDASGDVNGTRKVFPKNTAAFVEKYGQSLADSLIAEANITRKWRGFEPKKWVYAGYGIFQYDIQYIETDADFFIQKKWYAIENCLDRILAELKEKWLSHPNDLFQTVRSYNGSGKQAENYAWNVFQFLEWIEKAGI